MITKPLAFYRHSQSDSLPWKNEKQGEFLRALILIASNYLDLGFHSAYKRLA
jgi:hypothetical protein